MRIYNDLAYESPVQGSLDLSRWLSKTTPALWVVHPKVSFMWALSTVRYGRSCYVDEPGWLKTRNQILHFDAVKWNVLVLLICLLSAFFNQLRKPQLGIVSIKKLLKCRCGSSSLTLTHVVSASHAGLHLRCLEREKRRQDLPCYHNLPSLVPAPDSHQHLLLQGKHD